MNIPSVVLHGSEMADSTSTPPTLLLVDDEESILSSLKRIFRRDGYRVFTATGGIDALEILAHNVVDVIISDQRMPHMTGVEFLRQVKELYPETVRISLSGYTELQSITEAINEGAIYKFLTKPWDDDHLRANVVEAFRYKRMADENRRLAIELGVANDRLRRLLGEQEQQLQRDETTLGVVQEVLQAIPMPIIGLDDDGMIVIANRDAEMLLGKGSPLIGSFAEDVLPPALLPQNNLPQNTSAWEDQSGHRWDARFRRLGSDTLAQGTLIALSSQSDVPSAPPR
jgi:CheY-like chemotaxis protein